MIDENGTLDLTGLIETQESEFFNNQLIKKIIIGPTLQRLGDYSFFTCKNLEEINFSHLIKFL